jgi:hypothetical protein
MITAGENEHPGTAYTPLVYENFCEIIHKDRFSRSEAMAVSYGRTRSAPKEIEYWYCGRAHTPFATVFLTRQITLGMTSSPVKATRVQTVKKNSASRGKNDIHKGRVRSEIIRDASAATVEAIPTAQGAQWTDRRWSGQRVPPGIMERPNNARLVNTRGEPLPQVIEDKSQYAKDALETSRHTPRLGGSPVEYITTREYVWTGGR